MSKKLIILLFWVIPLWVYGQHDWGLMSRMSFYTHETLDEVLLHIPDAESGKRVNLTLSANGSLIQHADTILPKNLMRLPLPLSRLPEGRSKLVLWINSSEHNLELTTTFFRLQDKPNQVKIDRLTGSLITGQRLFYPWGFYCYSPVQPTLAEEEVVKGFNMLSPYQTIEEKTLEARQAYMDRCAQLGMKVHYNLLSVAGGGGVGSRAAADQTEIIKRERLIAEVNHFKDHPALLAWYISDEPTGHGATPEEVKASYDLVKELDPWHPVSVVFMAPKRAREYADGMDIVMADPYPVPNSDPASVGDVIRNLAEEFAGEKPVWMVPQAFGGAEHWGREPSLRELRLMTWLPIVEGATGVQFFVRHGRNGFPKSTATWDEAGRIGLEVQDLQNYLLVGNKIPGFTSPNPDIRILAREHGGDLLIVAVNRNNSPSSFGIDAPFSLTGSTIQVLYENRTLSPSDTHLEDLIDGYGVRIYLVSGYQDKPEYHPANLIPDPGFENVMSPGVPASCYARVGKDRGTTYFLDPVEPFEGKHSLRFVNTAAEAGIGLSFSPVRLSSGTGYTLAVYGKMDTTSVLPVKRRWIDRLLGIQKEMNPFFKMTAGTYADKTIQLSGDWARYPLHFRVPERGTETIAINPYLSLLSQGRAWFDRFELYPDPQISFGINPASRYFEVSATTIEPGAEIRFTLDGRVPDTSDELLSSAVTLGRTTTFTAGVFVDDQLVNYSSKSFFIHMAVGKKPIYENLYASKFTAGGEFGLVDGVRGTRDYQDGRWQGFMKRDLDVVINLEEIRQVSSITVGCLQDTRSWIFMPTKLEFWGTTDGSDLKPLGTIINDVDPKASGAIIKDYKIQFNSQPVKYIRVKVTNLGLCPDWHNGKGAAAYLFVDEIIVE